MWGGGKSILKIKAEEVPQMLPVRQASLQLAGRAAAAQALPAPAHRVSSAPCWSRPKHSMASCPQLLSLMAIPAQANNRFAQDPKNPSNWAVRGQKIVVHKRFMLSPANLSSVTSGFQSNRTWFKSLLGYCLIKIPFKCVITVRRKAGKQRWGNFKRY